MERSPTTSLGTVDDGGVEDSVRHRPRHVGTRAPGTRRGGRPPSPTASRGRATRPCRHTEAWRQPVSGRGQCRSGGPEGVPGSAGAAGLAARTDDRAHASDHAGERPAPGPRSLAGNGDGALRGQDRESPSQRQQGPGGGVPRYGGVERRRGPHGRGVRPVWRNRLDHPEHESHLHSDMQRDFDGLGWERGGVQRTPWSEGLLQPDRSTRERRHRGSGRTA